MNLQHYYKTLIFPTSFIILLFIGYSLYNLFYVEHDASVDNLISGKAFEAISVLADKKVDFADTKASLDVTFDYLKDISSPIGITQAKGRYNPFSSPQ